MIINSIDENTFSIDVPKTAYDFLVDISGMLFFKRLNNYSLQKRAYDEIKKFCYLPNKYTGKKEIIRLEKTEEKYNKLFIKVIRYEC